MQLRERAVAEWWWDDSWDSWEGGNHGRSGEGWDLLVDFRGSDRRRVDNNVRWVIDRGRGGSLCKYCQLYMG